MPEPDLWAISVPDPDNIQVGDEVTVYPITLGPAVETPRMCSVRATRATMTDEEFWAHVYPTDFAPEEPDRDEQQLQATPCTVCGETGACGYDAEGRPMIHTTEDDDE